MTFRATTFRAKIFRVTSFALIVAAAVLVASPGAKAFTIEDQGGARGGQGFKDPDQSVVPDRNLPVNRFGTDNGQTTMKQGNTTLQFGQQRSFSDRYNTDNIFNPYSREGR